MVADIVTLGIRRLMSITAQIVTDMVYWAISTSEMLVTNRKSPVFIAIAISVDAVGKKSIFGLEHT